MRFFRRYWIEILVFGGVFAGLLVDIVPKLSWMMCNSDVGANILASKYFYPEHGSGEPLSVLLGRLFLFIPIGSDSWRMGLESTLATVGGAIFVYFTVRELLADNKRVRLFAILASVIFSGAMLVVSQSGIVQLYALITMLCLGAFYFVVKKKWVMSCVMIGLGLAVHHLIVLTWLVLLVAHKEMRNWKSILITLSFLGLYLYIPISRHIIGAPDNWANTSVVSFFRANLATANMLIGTIAVWDFPARLFTTLGMVVISLGLGIIPLVWWLCKTKKWKNELLWLFALPIIYYIVDLCPDTMKYCEPSISFGAIIAVLGLSKMNIKWAYAVGIVAVGLLIFNINCLDIGRTLDPNLSAQKFYDEELPKIPDGDIFMTNSGWEWQLCLLYNKEESRNIIPICIGTLTGEPYLDQIEKWGVKLERCGRNMGDNERNGLVAKSILELNSNVWMDAPTDPTTYGARVIRGDNGQADTLLTRTGNTSPKWNFKPSNPYSQVTGDIQVKNWGFLTYSNWNMRLFIGLASIGLILNWLMFVRPAKAMAESDEKV